MSFFSYEDSSVASLTQELSLLITYIFNYSYV